MADDKTPGLIEQIKQENFPSLRDFLSKKNPFLPQIKALFSQTRSSKCARETLCAVFYDFFYSGDFPQSSSRVSKGYLNKIIHHHKYKRSSMWQREDVVNAFLDKILRGKVYYNDKLQASLSTYLYTVLQNTWIDTLKKNTREQNLQKKHAAYVAVEENPSPQSQQQQEEHLELVKKTILSMPSSEQRVTIKMWIPFICDYNFDVCEVCYLQSKNLVIDELVQQLQDEMDKLQSMKNSKKYHVPIKFIAQKLQEKNSDTIYKRIERFKEQLHNRKEEGAKHD